MKQITTWLIRSNAIVPGGVMGINITIDKSIWRVRKEINGERSGASMRSASDRQRVEIEKLDKRVVREIGFITKIVGIEIHRNKRGDSREGQLDPTRVGTLPPGILDKTGPCLEINDLNEKT